MLVQNKHLTTIWYEQNTDKIKIIDQRLIPFELKIFELNTLDEVCFAIKEMQVRGAPLIGVTAAYGMYIAARENIDLKKASEKINATRPTAVNLSWALNKIMTSIDDINKDDLPNKILELANQIRQEDINNCVILSGSFNPVHHGHVRLLDHSSSMCNIDKYYEISISNEFISSA